MKVLDVLRTEKKYLMPLAIAHRLAFQMKYVMQTDPYGKGNQGYQVRSVYFDSFEDLDFYEKAAGLECRKKIRLRTYSSGEIVKLEWKQKQNAVQRKRSLMIRKEEALALLQGEYGCLKRRPEPLAQEFYAHLLTQAYRPRCLVQYDRFALIDPLNDTRITFDRNLCAHEGCFGLFSSHPPLYPVGGIAKITLEVKYNRFLPDYIKNIISPYTESQVSASKYYMARKYGLGGTAL